jgi:hypothetical protein
MEIVFPVIMLVVGLTFAVAGLAYAGGSLLSSIWFFGWGRKRPALRVRIDTEYGYVPWKFMARPVCPLLFSRWGICLISAHDGTADDVFWGRMTERDPLVEIQVAAEGQPMADRLSDEYEDLVRKLPVH